MRAELYNVTVPAVHRRTRVSSIALLAVVTGMALGLSWTRAGQLLSDRVRPPGWPASFRPPAGFGHAETDATAVHASYQYVRRTPGGGLAVFEARHMRLEPRTDPLDVCRDALARRSGPLQRIFGQGFRRPQRERLGGLDAVELMNGTETAVARATVLASGDAIIVSLTTNGVSLNRALYRVFDLVCASVRFH